MRTGLEIAIVGMDGRFPGAASVPALWDNLCRGVESIRRFELDELRSAGVSPADLASPDYVPARAVLDGIGEFDAGYFGYTAREAELLDPQHRLLLECAVRALDDAGIDPERAPGLVGVWVGSGPSSYLVRNLLRSQTVRAADPFGVLLANDKDFLATRIAYALGLQGPAVGVQTACSTSLVAVHLACQGLLSGAADVALAGGVTVQVPWIVGYRHQPGGILSPDGRCRAFDADAAGTVEGSGGALVVLERLEDAEANGHDILAVIRGSAINNDGASKAGFTAPSVEGQTRAILAAMDVAGVHPDDLGYVEAHGTGTALGDPIEVAALERALRQAGRSEGHRCKLGAVKPNVGHLDTAAGVTGLIKASLAVRHGVLPATLHFRTPNPRAPLVEARLDVVSETQRWDAPRRIAGVSAFGIGGTNAHALVEQPPDRPDLPADTRPMALVLSGTSESGVNRAAAALAEHLAASSDRLEDVAWTLQVGRRGLPFRRVVVAADRADAVDQLRREAPARAVEGRPKVVGVCSGQGAPWIGAARGLYAEPVFREVLDRSCTRIRAATGHDLAALLLGEGDDDTLVQDTALAQPALAAFELAAARQLQAWGVVFSAWIGHSVGEYVAACLAEVISESDLLDLAVERGRVMREMPEGAMLAVALSEADVTPRLAGALSLAAVNGPDACVVAGRPADVERLEAELARDGIVTRRLRTRHAFHSADVAPSVGPLVERMRHVALGLPRVPLVSNVTGGWSTDEVCDPEYWGRHLRGTVRFGDGLATLAEDPDRVYVELGPGRALERLCARRVGAHRTLAVAGDGVAAEAQAAAVAGGLWRMGVTVDWARVHRGRRTRLHLPPTIFERERYWVTADGSFGPELVREPPERWTWQPSWTLSPPAPVARDGQRVLVAAAPSPWTEALCDALRRSGAEVVLAVPGSAFSTAGGGYRIDPGSREDWSVLLQELEAHGMPPDVVVHALSVGADGERVEQASFWSLLALGQALSGRIVPVGLLVVTAGVADVTGAEPLQPRQALALGPVRVLPLEAPAVRTTLLDLCSSEPVERQIDAIVSELHEPGGAVVAWRNGRRWRESRERRRLVEGAAPWRPGGVYLVTGGLGGVGLAVAEHLAEACAAKLVLCGRRGLPPEAEWDEAIGDQADRVEAVRRLRAYGAEVEVVAADLDDPDQVRALVDRAVVRFGTLHGVFHAAGVPGDGVIALKTADRAAAVLAPKVRGTDHLLAAVEGLPLDRVVLFSSLTASLPEPGTVDYVAANAYLDAVAASRSRAGQPVVSIGWDAWREVGMAARLLQDAPPADRPAPDADRRTFDPDRDWVLDEHRILRKATLPGTATVGWMAAYAGEPLGRVQLLAPLVAENVREVRVSRAGGRVTVHAQTATGWQVLATAQVRDALPVAPLDPAAIRARVVGRRIDGFGLPESGIAYGPRWTESLREAVLGEGEGWAELVLPEKYRADLDQWPVHPALLDVALGFAVPHLVARCVPWRYHAITVVRPLPAAVFCALRWQVGAETLRVDATLSDLEGRPCVRVQGYELKRLDTGEAPRGTLGPAELDQLRQRLAFALHPDEALDLLDRIAADGSSRVIVSTLDPDRLVEEAARARAQILAGPGAATHARPELATGYVAPSNDTEAVLAGIWSQVFGVEPIGVDDGFFDLGGHSLLALQLLSRIRSAFQVELPMETLFETPTVRQLAAGLIERAPDTTPRLAAAMRAAGATELDREALAAAGVTLASAPTIPRRAPGVVPTSYAQQRMWFLDQVLPGMPYFNMPGTLRLRGDLDVDALVRALRTIVARHETLRTRFAVVDGQPVQVIDADARLEVPLEVLDLPEAEREPAAYRRFREDAHLPFDLAAGPVIRARLVRLTPTDHLLLMTVHHIVSDGWSLGVLLAELAATYSAFVAGRPCPLPELAVQYGDYAAWQRQQMDGEPMREHLAYWKERFASPPAPLDLPADAARPAVQTYRAGRITARLPRTLSEAIKAATRTHGVTLFMVMVTAFDAVFHRLTGRTDLALGTPVAVRSPSSLEPLIGCLLNTVVVRVDLAGDPSLRELLARVRQATLGAYAHQDLPFERLLEELQLARDPGRTPLFEVFLNVLNFPAPQLDFTGLQVATHFDPIGSKFDLTPYVLEEAEGIRFDLVYNADLFAAERMNELLDQLRMVLEQLVADPEVRLSALSLLTPNARASLPDASAPLPIPHHEPVPATIAAWAARTPDAVAIEQGADTLSYAQFGDAVRDLARTLRSVGVAPGAAVAVTGERSPGLVVAMAAVLAARGVLLTLDRALPVERQALMLDASAARVAVAVGATRPEDVWLQRGRTVVGVDRRGRPAAAPAEIELPPPSPDDPAYVFFTSGTTGIPKGVLGRHAGLAHFLAWQRSTYGVGPGDRSAQLTGLSFDVVLRDVFLPLTSGATLVLPADPHAALSAGASWLGTAGITLLHTVPSIAQTWLGAHPERLHDLRVVFFAGEPLPGTLVTRWREAAPGARVVNLYGPTETTLAKFAFDVPEPPRPGVQPVGWALPETQAVVLGPAGLRCGLGEPGEICIRTPFRTFGYLDAPEEQQAKFVRNPFTDDPHDLLYRTGDRGRVAHDGSLEILGRLDDQVKIRGVRVEPAEVQLALGRHPAVRAAVVVARDDEGGELRLVGYLVCDPTLAEPTPAELRAFVGRTLPEAAVPSVFVSLPALPLTANGKVDRRALPAPAAAAPPPAPASRPWTELEEVVGQAWREVLGHDRFAVDQNFFDAGGHSLALARVHARLKARFPDLGLMELFRYPSVAALAGRLAPAPADRAASADLDRARSRHELLEARRLRRSDRSGGA